MKPEVELKQPPAVPASMVASGPNSRRGEPGPRLPFLDHLRWSVVLLVVTMHAAVTYSGIGSWYFREPAALGPVSLATFLACQTHLQAFFMGLLFFVAGYFVPAAYDRKGPGKFLRDRALRLGAPTLLYALLLQPVTSFAAQAISGNSSASSGKAYWQYLIGLQFLGGTGPMWFALALLIFAVAYAAVRCFHRGPPVSAPSLALPTHRGVMGFVVGLTAVTFLVRVVQPVGTSVLNLQLCFFPQYVALFGMGVVAFRQDWLRRVPRRFALGWFRLALTAGPALWLGMLVSARVWTGDYSLLVGGLHWQSALYCLWETLFCTGACLGLLVLGRDHANQHTRITQFLADNSFGVYVFHPPILILLTMALHPLAWPPLMKFVLLSVLGMIACVLASHWIWRRIPGLRRLL